MAVLVHPVFTRSPRLVAAVEQATGRVAIPRNKRVYLIKPHLHDLINSTYAHSQSQKGERT